MSLNAAGHKKIVRENHLDFLFNLYLQGIEIGSDNVDLLKKHGYVYDPPPQKKEDDRPEFINFHKLDYSTDKNRAADSKIDIVYGEPEACVPRFEILHDHELEERRKIHGLIFEGREEDIEKHEWLPKSLTEHEADFIDWINSINNLGFQNKIHYRKFTLYVQQAYRWLQERSSTADFEDEDLVEAYKDRELQRCNTNSLYFLNKYVFYKEGDDEEGRVKYVASKAHEVMAYMNDCGYSTAYAKGRQMAATTTLMALDVKDMIFKKNHFMKFVTEDKEKAQEIFEDKLKFAFSELPWWMKPDVSNERENLFKLGKKEEDSDGKAVKGTKKGVGSKILVVAPKRTAIAGGAPQKVKIDEAGNIPLLGKMINNIRPTMLKYNHRTKKIEVKRMLVFWGTGGEMAKGGKAFETEFMSLIKQWADGDYSACIVPIFFNWTCRPGATQEDYDREKRVAYSKLVSEDERDCIIEFHQTWPSSLADVFRANARTLVPEDYIKSNMERISNETKRLDHKLTKRGYFEPVFDETKPTEEGSDVPYKIVGAVFVPTEDLDPRASVDILFEPNYEWKNRYFQGTDPIQHDTGMSNMSSTVWDKYFKTKAAVLNFRTRNPKDVFMQTLLLGLYYDTRDVKIGIPELVESNQGQSYTQYKEAKGFFDSFVLNSDLPPYLVNQSTINQGVGIDNKGHRNNIIVNRIQEMTVTYGDRFYHLSYWDQLTSFTCAVSDKTGKEMWGPMNRKYFKDDILFGAVFSYICAELAMTHLVPKNMNDERKKYTIKYIQKYDANYNLIRVPVKVMQ